MTITPYLPQLLVAWAAYFIAVATPGPGIMVIVSASTSKGRKAGMITALGVISGSMVWASLASLGLAALLATYAQALSLLKIGGGLYLFYLAWKAMRAAASTQEPSLETGTRDAAMSRLYLKGLMTHLTNPKAIFVWIALVSLGLPHEAPWWITPFFILVCLLVGVTTMMTFAILFSMRPVLDAYRRARRGIEGFMALFFGFAGFKLIASA